MRILDLSVRLAPELPCSWPGLTPFSTTETLNLPRDQVFCRSILTEEHTGTHADAPNHIAALDGGPVDAIAIDEVPLDRFVGPARVLDVRDFAPGEPGRSPWVTPDHLERLSATGGPLQPGDALLLLSGWSDRYYLPFPEGSAYVADCLGGRSPGWPAFHPETIDVVAAAGVRLLGVDTPSLGAAHDSLPPHRAALGHGLGVIENLTGLSRIPRGATFLFLPLPNAGGSGAPGRAVALTNTEEEHI